MISDDVTELISEEPRYYDIGLDEIVVKQDHLSAILHTVEYFEHKAVYYNYQPETRKEFLTVLSEIKKDVARTIRERRRE